MQQPQQQWGEGKPLPAMKILQSRVETSAWRRHRRRHRHRRRPCLQLPLLPLADIAAKIYGKFTAWDICCGFYKLSVRGPRCLPARVECVWKRGWERATTQSVKGGPVSFVAAVDCCSVSAPHNAAATSAAQEQHGTRDTLSALPFVPHHGESAKKPVHGGKNIYCRGKYIEHDIWNRSSLFFQCEVYKKKEEWGVTGGPRVVGIQTVGKVVQFTKQNKTNKAKRGKNRKDNTKNGLTERKMLPLCSRMA